VKSKQDRHDSSGNFLVDSERDLRESQIAGVYRLVICSPSPFITNSNTQTPMMMGAPNRMKPYPGEMPIVLHRSS
jgi:hypothetical protein